MKRLSVAIFAVGALLCGTAASAAEIAAKSAIVKGTVTIAGKPTSEVVVSVEGVAPEGVKARLAAMKPKPTIMDQRATKFSLTVLPIGVGTKVAFPNNDKSWHNVYSKGGANDFDLGLYPPGETRSATFAKPGISRILCNAHPNMEAFIVVKEHPFFSSADKGGNFRIDGIPLGKYRITVWHPELGMAEAGVELVRDGQVSNIDFDLKKK